MLRGFLLLTAIAGLTNALHRLPGLATKALHRLPVLLEKTTLHVASRTRANAPAATLSQFISSLSPQSLATGLKRNLPPGTLRITAPEGDSDLLLVEFERRVSLGPAVLNLFVQPRVVVWLRNRGKSILAEGHLCGVHSSDSEMVRLSALAMRCEFTAVEGPLTHLQGDSVAVLLLKTSVKSEVEVSASRGWKRWLPHALLLRIASRRLLAELLRLQNEIATCLVAEYESCREDWLTPAPIVRLGGGDLDEHELVAT